MRTRRDFLHSTLLSLPVSATSLYEGCASRPNPPISRVEVVTYEGPQAKAPHLEIESSDGTVGVFGPLGWNLPDRFRESLPQLRELLIGHDPLDRGLEFASLWDAFYPGKPLRVYAEGLDPLSGERIWGTIRSGRHSPTGSRIMTLSAVVNTLWDLRGKLARQPVFELIGNADRRQIAVYSRVGEGKDLNAARRLARERFERGHKHQKWYFVFGPKDGRKGQIANLELVRVLREELGPAAVLMFDNHSMRHQIGPDWVVELAKQMLPYDPFWLEEPTAPEDIDGYERIKGETGITVAGGEHHYTRWQIKPLLDRKCLDWVQADPDWTGGISEWVRIYELARQYPGVHVVPHCDNFMTSCQCVASQPASLCPMAEYNDGQTERKMSFRTRVLRPQNELLDTPLDPGLGPDLDHARIQRVS